jgi:hypothetical protein
VFYSLRKTESAQCTLGVDLGNHAIKTVLLDKARGGFAEVGHSLRRQQQRSVLFRLRDAACFQGIVDCLFQWHRPSGLPGRRKRLLRQPGTQGGNGAIVGRPF